MCMMAVVYTACQDDDSFSTSPSSLLTFSADTIRLDTIFSRVPTATKTFWVYNYSGDGIRCASVRLERGNQTGFRVNVDGVYLGPSTGYQVNGVEVRNKDSVRVFVELTSPQMLADSPTRIEDNLVFSLENGRQQKVNLNAFAWDADLLHDVVIDRDTTIQTDRPIVIYGGLKIDSTATLTIGAGTTLYFHADAGIDVYGRFICEGTAERNVVLRGDRIDHMFDYLPYDRVSGQWQGVRFHESSYENSLNFTDIHSAMNGIVCDSASVGRLKLSLYNSVVHNCQGYGLLTTNAVLDIFNTQLSNTLNDCLAIYGGGVMLRHCTLAQFYPFDARRGVALRFANNRDGHVWPLHQMDVLNSIVTGYADDVIMGEADTTVAYTYRFDHCLLRTPALEDTVQVRDIIWEDPKDTVAGGEKNFRLIDTRNLRYDFRLDTVSRAGNAGVRLSGGYSDYDRLGVRRDEEPDLGAYESASLMDN